MDSILRNVMHHIGIDFIQCCIEYSPPLVNFHKRPDILQRTRSVTLPVIYQRCMLGL